VLSADRWAIAVKPPVDVDNGECGSDGIPMVAAGTLVLVAAGTLGLFIVIAPPAHPLFSLSLITAVFISPVCTLVGRCLTGLPALTYGHIGAKAASNNC